MANYAVSNYADLINAQLAQQQMQQAGLGNYAQLGGLGSAGTGSLTTANTSAGISGSTIYLTGLSYNSEVVYPPANPVMKDDEFSWLRKRVEDVCWRRAA